MTNPQHDYFELNAEKSHTEHNASVLHPATEVRVLVATWAQLSTQPSLVALRHTTRAQDFAALVRAAQGFPHGPYWVCSDWPDRGGP